MCHVSVVDGPGDVPGDCENSSDAESNDHCDEDEERCVRLGSRDRLAGRSEVVEVVLHPSTNFRTTTCRPSSRAMRVTLRIFMFHRATGRGTVPLYHELGQIATIIWGNFGAGQMSSSRSEGIHCPNEPNFALGCGSSGGCVWRRGVRHREARDVDAEVPLPLVEHWERLPCRRGDRGGCVGQLERMD